MAKKPSARESKDYRPLRIHLMAVKVHARWIFDKLPAEVTSTLPAHFFGFVRRRQAVEMALVSQLANATLNGVSIPP